MKWKLRSKASTPSESRVKSTISGHSDAVKSNEREKSSRTKLPDFSGSWVNISTEVRGKGCVLSKCVLHIMTKFEDLNARHLHILVLSGDQLHSAKCTGQSNNWLSRRELFRALTIIDDAIHME